MIITDPKVRAYLYGILVAAGSVALIYRFVTGEQLAAWIALGGAILGNGLALANINPKNGRHEA